jgi:DNA-binding NarL/FixJ family response regulator
VIKILVADDQPLVRDGLRAILEAERGLEVVGEAANGREVVQLVREMSPDLAVIDIRMPELDGLEATRHLMREPNPPRVVILTTFDLDEYVYEAMKAGASGFLLKDAPRAQLIAGIRLVAAGDALLSPAITQRLIEHFVRRPPLGEVTPAALAELSERELEVLRLIARGLSNAEIAKELYLGEATVKSHVGHILRKLDLRDRVQAVVLAYESGLVEAGSART